MNCMNCGSKMKKRKETLFHYTDCGLSKIYLKGIEVSECTNTECGEEEIILTNLQQLHNILAMSVASQKNKLLPEEIRFLRTCLGFSSVDFAEHVGVTPETVSRWESGSVNMKETTEKLLRVLILSKTGPFQNYDDLKEFAKINRKTALKRTFKASKSHWIEDKAA